jgi:hypothetical protein
MEDGDHLPLNQLHQFANVWLWNRGKRDKRAKAILANRYVVSKLI